MYTLNFPNGNVQTYSSVSDLDKAARLLGGEAKQISGNTYAFVPKKWVTNKGRTFNSALPLTLNVSLLPKRRKNANVFQDNVKESSILLFLHLLRK